MKFVCWGCKKVVDKKDVVLVVEDIWGLTPYCTKCLEAKKK